MSGADLEGSGRGPLASLGSEACFLDAILGEILQPQLSEAAARQRAWGRRRNVAPSAPPLEEEEVGDTPITPGDVSLERGSAPDHDVTSERLLELVTALADTLPPPPADPCEMTRCDSWQFSSLVDPADALDHRSNASSPSTCSSFESLSRALNGLSTRASMYLPRERSTLPPRPRSASPTLPAPSPLQDDDGDMDSFVTAVVEPEEESEGRVRSPGQPRVRSHSTGSHHRPRQSTQPGRSASGDPLPSKPSLPHLWLRMSMRRVRPFRLEAPPGTSGRPSSAPAAPSTATTSRPSRGRRRRISSSTSRRRENAQNDPVSPDHSWTSHPISDDETPEVSDSAASTPRRQPRPRPRSDNPFR